MVDVRAVYADGPSVNVAGTLSGPQLVQKIVQINGRNFDLRAEGVNLIINYSDQPGALGKIGTLLGGAGVNIEAAQLSQDADGEGATIMLRLDRDVPEDVRAAIATSVERHDPGSGGSVMRLAIIAGDGIGPEVIEEAVKVLDTVLPGVEKTEYDLGARRYHATGEMLPDSMIEELRGHDAILLGAIGDPSVPAGAARTWPAAASCGSPSTITSTCGRDGCIRVSAARWRRRRRSTSSSCAKAPRARTPATAARCGWAPRTRWPPR